MGGLSDFVGTAVGGGLGFLVGGPAGAAIGASLGGGIDAAGAARSAAGTQAGAAQAGIAETQRQFDITQEQFQPFLEAATGTPQFNRIFDPSRLAPHERERFETLRGMGSIDEQGFRIDPTTGRREILGREGGALQQFQAGIEQAPAIPQLQRFQGQAVQAPTLQRFQGQAVRAPTLGQAPQLEQFRFDPQAALDNPALAFQREMGEQVLERQLGKNRSLGSGQRLIEAQRLGQGLAAQSIGDEFQRQLAASQARNQAAGTQFQQQLGRDVQQFGLGSQQLGQQIGLSELANQQAIQQQGLQRQQLSDEQALAQQEQNRLLTQYGLTSDQFNQRLNRLAGLVDVGRGAAGSLSSAGQTAGANTANLLAAQGQAQAAGRLGQQSAIGGALQQGVGLAALGGAFTPQPQQNPLLGGGFTTGGQVFAGPTRINA